VLGFLPPSRPLRVLPLLLLVVLSASLAPHAAATTTVAPTGIIVPLYSYPGSAWTALIQTKQSEPSVPFVAVVNPDSGPGSVADPNYAAGIQQLQAAGITVVGYVYTSYASRPIASVEADIYSYSKLYHVKGVFLDQVPNVKGYEAYYSALNSYAKSLGMTYTVGNPGTSVPTTYIGTLDTMIIYERPSLPSITSIAARYPGYSVSNFAIVAYDTPLPSQAYISGISEYAGYLYFTDGTWPAPYASLPSYLTGEVTEIKDAVPTSVPLSLSVDSVSLTSEAISGLWTTIQSNGVPVLTGYTPLALAATPGATYTVCVANYQNYVFAHWSSGSTNPCATVTTAQSTVLTAYYQTGPSNQ